MIEIGSKWVHTRTGNRYEVVCLKRHDFKVLNAFAATDRVCVWYKDQDGEIYVRTEKHFLDSFKPYEPVKQEFIVIKQENGVWNGWDYFFDRFMSLKKPMMYKITVEEIF